MSGDAVDGVTWSRRAASILAQAGLPSWPRSQGRAVAHHWRLSANVLADLRALSSSTTGKPPGDELFGYPVEVVSITEMRDVRAGGVLELVPDAANDAVNAPDEGAERA